MTQIMKIDDIEKIIEPVGLIHIDTEGWEIEVLRGCHNILSNQINHFILITECCERTKKAWEDQ